MSKKSLEKLSKKSSKKLSKKSSEEPSKKLSKQPLEESPQKFFDKSKELSKKILEKPSKKLSDQSKKPSKKSLQKGLTLDSVTKANHKPPTVLICQKSSCCKKGSLKVSQAIESELIQAGRLNDVIIKATGCMNHCKARPNMVILPAKSSYKKVTPDQARSLIKDLL